MKIYQEPENLPKPGLNTKEMTYPTTLPPAIPVPEEDRFTAESASHESTGDWFVPDDEESSARHFGETLLPPIAPSIFVDVAPRL